MSRIPPFTSKIAFLYPGQGAVPERSPEELYSHHPVVEQIYTALATPDCMAFGEFHQWAAMNDLRAQLGVYNISYALGQAVIAAGIKPDCVAGYSSGLYAALAAANGCEPQQGTEIILKAYELMAACDLEQEYAMVAVIGLDAQTINRLFTERSIHGWISLYNNRRQIIVSIPQADVKIFSAACEEAGSLRVMDLPFQRPCHIPPLQAAGERMINYFKESPLAASTLPYMAGPEPRFLRDPHDIAQAICDQLWQPVDWYSTVKALINCGFNLMVCLDPTGVLCRIVRWINREIDIISIQSSADIEKLQINMGCIDKKTNLQTA